MGRLLRVGIVVLLLLVGSYFGWRRWESWRFQEVLTTVDRNIQSELFGRARETLLTLEATQPGQPEVLYRLGLCELREGRPETALSFWDRVPNDSSAGPKTAVQRATLFTNTGRYAPAESALAPFVEPKVPSWIEPADRRDLRKAWTRLLRFEGRTADVRRVLREGLADGASGDEVVATLKELWLLDTTAIPTDGLATVLSKADPKDSRVWLGRANLALSNGQFVEAEEALAKAELTRPSDPANARTRLNLARERGDLDAVWKALETLPAASLNAVESAELRVWIAQQTQQAEAERNALNDLIRLESGHPGALERLAALEGRAGSTSRSQDWRLKKAAVDRARDQYRKLVLNETNIRKYAEDLIKLSETLGRTFDARAWGLVRDLGTTAESVRRDAIGLWEPGELPEIRQENAHAIDLVADLRQTPKATKSVATRNNPAVPIQFVEKAGTAGLTFRFENGATRQHQLPETMSGGVGVLDFDGDGWMDVYLVQGGPFPHNSDPKRPGDRLFRNRGNGTFEDVTEKAGLPGGSVGYGHGVAVGDYDNDGKPDLFVTRFDAYALYHNEGGKFKDVTASAGLGGRKGWPTSAVLADLDSDGDLDLYVCHYMVWNASDPVLCQDDKGQYLYCDPSRAAAEPDHLFRNDRGRFVDISKAAGIVDKDGRGLGVIAADVDGDHKLDLFVANDGTANYLFKNTGVEEIRFREMGDEAGVAANADGGYHAGMGIASGDLDGDGKLDLLVTNFFGEAATFYQGLGEGLFTDRTSASGLGLATRHRLGFGIVMIDADSDGWLDVAIANGHVNDNRPYFPYAMPPQILRNVGGGRLLDVSQSAGRGWSSPKIARGLASVDLDNDGRSDLLFVNQADELTYQHNVTRGGHRLILELQAKRGHRDAVGAVVRIKVGDRTITTQKVSGGSYQSASDGRIILGLGSSTTVDAVEVDWPSGHFDTWSRLPADSSYRLREGEPAPERHALIYP